MQPIALRRARPLDAPTVGRLLSDFNTEFAAPTPPLATVTGRFAGLLARDDVLVLLSGDVGRETGFAFLTLRPTPYSDGPTALLEELYVVPDRRGGGIGTALLGGVFEHLRSRGCEEVQVNVDEDDTDARRFYERHGFFTRAPGADYMMLFYERSL